MSAIDDYVEKNAQYANQFSKSGLAGAPARKIAIVACMDARMVTAKLLGIEEGEAHVIRNAGGVVTDDVIRSLMISQRCLGTEEIMFVHHTNCGMMTFTDDELKDRVEKETGVRPPFPVHAFTDLDEDVRLSVTRIQDSPFIANKDCVRGFVYDVDTGRLREVK